MTLVEALSEDITDKLDKFGANILIVPKTENLSLTYGGLSLGGVSFEMEEIQEEQLKEIATIRNAANVAALGPSSWASSRSKTRGSFSQVWTSKPPKYLNPGGK